jgi:hypothetical protein
VRPEADADPLEAPEAVVGLVDLATACCTRPGADPERPGRLELEAPGDE